MLLTFSSDALRFSALSNSSSFFHVGFLLKKVLVHTDKEFEIYFLLSVTFSAILG